MLSCSCPKRSNGSDARGPKRAVDSFAGPRAWPEEGLPQEAGSDLEEFVGRLGVQPVACPLNGVVVHVQEVFF